MHNLILDIKHWATADPRLYLVSLQVSTVISKKLTLPTFFQACSPLASHIE